MPPYFGMADFVDALQNCAVPELEDFANNEHLRDRAHRRFDSDEPPPPYQSSTESEEPDERNIALEPYPESPESPESPQHDSPPRQSTFVDLSPSLPEVMEHPLDDDELAQTADRAKHLLRPRTMYLDESSIELNRYLLAKFPTRGKSGTRLKQLRRRGVKARHIIKSRWQKLGIWNPEWGFPGRNLRPSDKVGDWRWKWERQDADQETISQETHQLALRALRLRQNLRRGEWVPATPRRRLGPDSSTAEAESFLISRPWFLYRLDLEEEYTKLARSSNDDPKYWKTIELEHWRRWEENGEYRLADDGAPCYWKWRHESPSPEREHTPTSPGISYTPSEVDELETIGLPRPQQPASYWVQNGPKPLVGQCKNPGAFSRTPSPTPSPRTRFARLGSMPDIYIVGGLEQREIWLAKKREIEAALKAMEGNEAELPDQWPTPPPLSPRARLKRLGPMPEHESLFGDGGASEWRRMKKEIDDALEAVQARRVEQEQGAADGDDEAMPDEEEPVEAVVDLQRAGQSDQDGAGGGSDAAAAPPRQTQGKPRARSRRAEAVPAPDVPQPPAPRRSARNALKRGADPPSPQDAPPNKRTRLVRAEVVAAAMPKRGRPSKQPDAVKEETGRHHSSQTWRGSS
ncbi:hypothetical protein GGTG_13145 [Gaeumannomyces tritici R3-111a-1]|uniref:Uncharacterized protein n=1 Tax=Gaeumannomyces tritici (strain R3-111a-1) TaxID=644352 RepID=J3PI14_GAET3|nr:hypothetical protein GGTG_13145 [Gaeumannomyces tritici R3-111a-1]EJT69526.1 hypothetical protein GGTG_13145 [Gaeumannomyces tritici R3-111a-1]